MVKGLDLRDPHGAQPDPDRSEPHMPRDQEWEKRGVGEEDRVTLSLLSRTADRHPKDRHRRHDDRPPDPEKERIHTFTQSEREGPGPKDRDPSRVRNE